MNKWYRPFGFLLLASLAGEMCGCAQSSGWLAKRGSRKGTEERLADAGKKKSGKPASAKAAKELAEMKTDESKSALGGGKGKSKGLDAEHSKLASADSAEKSKKSKSRGDGSDPLSSKESVASSAATKAKSQTAAKTAGMDSFLSDLESSSAKVKKQVDDHAAGEFEAFDDAIETAQKSVLQVKKEIQQGADSFDSDVADWASDHHTSEPQTVTAAKASSLADVFENELPLAEPPASSADAKGEADSELSELPSLASLKKAAVKKVVGRGLSALCPDASGPLAEVLSEVDPTDAQSVKVCLHKIGQMGSDGVAAAPVLQKMLHHDDAFVRANAALAMSKLKISSPESIKVVTDCVASRDANLRSFGATMLGEMGAESSQVLTSLSGSLNDKDGQTRLRAAEILIRHEEYAYPALQTILSSLSDKDSNVRWLAAYSLAELAPESPAAVQALVKASQDPVSKVRVGAVYALGEIGPYAKRAANDLRNLQKTTTDEELKDAIACSLEQIEK